MTSILLAVGDSAQIVDGADDPILAEAAGPAVILDFGDDAVDSGAPSLSECISAPHRPLAYREAGAGWTTIDFEAADHWVQMGPELRGRLVDDYRATLDVSEFKIATNGGSASIITNNWVYSGSPRAYRVAGQLREFVTVLSELSADAR